MSAAVTAASTYLFVPGNRPDRYAKALSSGADAVIVDLEDAVALPAKEEARKTLAQWVHDNGPQPKLWVRVNAADTTWHDDDIDAFAPLPVAGIVLPKAEEPKAVAAIAARLRPGRGVIALIESAAGLAAMRQIAAVPGVLRLAFGSIDAQVDLGMQCDPYESELLHFRVEMVMASRLAGIASPIDGVTTTFEDMAFLSDAVQRARRIGFGAKLCIHPKQIAEVRQGFMPTPEELVWAREVMKAVRQSDGGAISLNGKMIDKPVILLAEKFLHQADELDH